MDYVAFSFHDCYARYRLPHYEDFLREIRTIGNLKTFGEVAGDLYPATGA